MMQGSRRDAALNSDGATSILHKIAAFLTFQ